MICQSPQHHWMCQTNHRVRMPKNRFLILSLLLLFAELAPLILTLHVINGHEIELKLPVSRTANFLGSQCVCLDLVPGENPSHDDVIGSIFETLIRVLERL